MTRYTRRSARIRAVDYRMDRDDIVHPGTITVHEDDDWRPTGLLDKDGFELGRVDRAPMGFQFKEADQ